MSPDDNKPLPFNIPAKADLPPKDSEFVIGGTSPEFGSTTAARCSEVSRAVVGALLSAERTRATRFSMADITVGIASAIGVVLASTRMPASEVEAVKATIGEIVMARFLAYEAGEMMEGDDA